MANGYQTVATARLDLRAVTVDDLDDLHRLHADPRVWRHLPQGRHTDRARTARLVDTMVREWQEGGLGYWAVRLHDDLPGGPAAGTLIGVAGAARRPGPVWNLYYRFAPEAQGRGLAHEVIVTALAAVAHVDPVPPVIAYLLEHNTASKRTAERAGLRLVWRGPDHGSPERGAIRLVYADRALPPDLLGDLLARL